MSTIYHGDTITLLAQAQPSFQRTKGGGFDTGRRRFKVLISNIERALERVFVPGRSDFDTLRAAEGRVSVGYRTMFVDSVTLDNELLGEHAILNVEYRGLIAKKKDSVEIMTGTEEQSFIPTVSGQTIVSAVRVEVPVPTVVHRYVSTKGRPAVTAPGQAMEPPAIAARETELLKQYYADWLPSSGYTVFEGWKLKNRTTTSPGNVLRHPFWETEDTYNFVVHRAQTS